MGSNPNMAMLTSGLHEDCGFSVVRDDAQRSAESAAKFYAFPPEAPRKYRQLSQSSCDMATHKWCFFWSQWNASDVFVFERSEWIFNDVVGLELLHPVSKNVHVDCSFLLLLKDSLQIDLTLDWWQIISSWHMVTTTNSIISWNKNSAYFPDLGGS